MKNNRKLQKRIFQQLLSLSVFCFTLISTGVHSQTTVQVGTSTSVSAYTPVYSFNAFNYSQQIYKGTENSLSTYSGQYITAIRFYWTGSGNMNNAGTWDIFMGNTAQASFSSTINWISLGSMTQVYSGTVSLPASAGWMTIILDAPFQYTGNNIVVAVDENAAGYSTSGCTYQYTTATNDVLYYRNDVTNPDPAAPPTGTLNSSRPNIQFDFFNTPNPPNVVSVTATSGTASRSYPAVQYAFDALNSGVHMGDIAIEIGSAGNQTFTLSNTIDVLPSGTGSASYSNVLVRPAYPNITLTSSLASSSTIRLSKTSSVVFDGRIESSGSTCDLTIENSSTGSASRGAIEFYGASGNIIRYCNLKSSTTSSTNGLGTISMNYNSNSGPSNNLIEFSNVTKSGANLPNFAIASSNTSSTYKSENNIVQNCNISDFQRAGIWLGNSGATDYNNLWTIRNNHFFEAAPIALSATNYFNWAIYIGYHSSSNSYRQSSGVFNISGNMIGGDGVGGDWTVTSASGTYTVAGGIFIYGSTSEFSEISGNIIENFSIQTYVADQSYYKLYGFDGIYNHLSKIKIGTTAGNEIRNISIVHSSANWGGFVSGIYSGTSSNLSCEIMNNSIHDISLSSGNNEFQYVYGIYSYAGSSISTNRTNNNEVYNINAIKGRYVNGLYIDGGAEQNHVSRIATDGTIGELYGIRWAVTGSSNASTYRIDNNEIFLGLDAAGNSTAVNKNIYGIFTNSQDVILYYNSILIDGTATSNNSACIRINTTGAGTSVTNNLLYNNRTGGTGRHLCISSAINLATNPGYLTSSNNAYIFGGNMGEYNTATAFSGGSTATTLADWTAAATNEINSRDTLNSQMPVSAFFPNCLLSNNLIPSAGSWLCAGCVVAQTSDYMNVARNNPAPTTIGAYELDCPTILPIVLTAFKANCTEAGVSISWTTTSETNNNFFTIEKSINGENFEPILQIAGAGNSNQILHYEAIDFNNDSETRYYRLMQTDYDGSSSYSNIISVNCSGRSFEASISPNPFIETVEIALSNTEASSVNVFLLNKLGQIIPIDISIAGSGKIILNTPDGLAEGYYFIKITSETQIQIFKIMKL